jgi:MarR family 2-MHQ and catechol resistance regulon transcriptional repressor
VRPLAEFETAARARLGSVAPELDLDSFQAVWLLHESASAARRHLERRALARHQLSWTQFEVLWQLWLFGAQDHGEIATDVRMSKASVTAITTALATRGLLARTASDDDRRRVSYALTGQGIGLMRELFPPFNRAEAEVSQGLTPGEKAALAGLLRRLLASAP